MKKMISVINDNLRSVISGIKTHKEETEKKLATLRNDIDAKVEIASEYKMNVENARKIISNLENEISDLENDLNELNAKFGAKDFKEILAAGNREISTKIIEKRALISEQSQNILELTDKAHILKDELISLKARKNQTEETLNKTIILESYYEKRIKSIVDYSEEHPEKLSEFVEEVPQEELFVSGDDLDSVDILNTIDGSVFEEIDELSTSDEVNEDLIQEVLVEDIAEEEIEVQEVDTIEELDEGIDLSMTQQLDSIILEANNLLEKSEQIKERMDSHKIEGVDYETIIDNKIFEEASKVVEEPTEEIEELNNDLHIFVDDDLENNSINEELIVTPSLEERIDIVKDDEDDDDEDIINLVIENDDENIQVFENTSINLSEDLKECNLDETRFSETDLNKLNKAFNKNNTISFMEVMNKHKIPLDTIYSSADVLVKVTPQNLDQMLTILANTKATTKDIIAVFNALDTVNINKLEEIVDVNNEAELSEILYEAATYKGESDLISKLGLKENEEMELRKNASVDEFKMMNMVPNVVLANYETLKSLRVNNLKDCITKHPKRFIYNPTHFTSILDKYDTEDLIRCINKNSAVLDRL